MQGKVNEAFRVWLAVKLGTGAPATGVASIDFTLTVRNPGNTASEAPSVTEFGGGLYFFDVSATFTNTHGVGNYGWVVDVDSTTPRVVDTGGGVIVFELRDRDDLAQPGDAMDLVAGAVDAAAVATGAIDADALATDAVNEIRDAILSDSTPFAGANIDAAITSRSSHTAADAADAVWDEAAAAHVAPGSMGEALDAANATISSVASAVAALNDLSQADVQSAMTAQGYTATRAAELSEILDHLKNRLFIDFGPTPAELVLRDRTNTSDLLRWPLETEGGEKVSTQFGVQTRRGVPV